MVFGFISFVRFVVVVVFDFLSICSFIKQGKDGMVTLNDVVPQIVLLPKVQSRD